jgi:hypothetical protein
MNAFWFMWSLTLSVIFLGHFSQNDFNPTYGMGSKEFACSPTDSFTPSFTLVLKRKMRCRCFGLLDVQKLNAFSKWVGILGQLDSGPGAYHFTSYNSTFVIFSLKKVGESFKWTS